MANEITLTATLAYADAESASISLQVAALAASVTTKRYVYAKQNIATSEVAIGLGNVTALGWAFFINRDATNFIELRVATAGIKFAKIQAGKLAFFYFGSGVTAPFAIADTGACQLEYLILSQ